MKKGERAKSALKERDERRMKGELFSKARLQAMSPPSFLEREEAKRQVILKVEIDISENIKKMIVIRHGDNLSKVADAFAQQHNLSLKDPV